MPYLSFAGTIARWAVKKPSTRLYPFRKRPSFAATRGHIRIEIESCIFCALCQRRCPTAAIELSKNERQWAIDRLRCIQCGACVEACPRKCLFTENAYSPAVTAKTTDRFVQQAKPAAPQPKPATP